MPQEVVFDTEAEAETQQAADLQVHLAAVTCGGSCPPGCKCEKYAEQTTRWATPKQRLDGKWAYPCCEHQDYTGFTVEPYDPANYPAEEE